MAAKVIWAGKLSTQPQAIDARVVYRDDPEGVVIESRSDDALGEPAWAAHPADAGIAQEILLEVIKSLGKAP